MFGTMSEVAGGDRVVTGSLFLSGGGDAEDSLPLDSAFASAVGAGPVWYWPVAMDPAENDYAACLEWFNGVFAPLGITEVQMWDGVSGEAAERLSDFRGVYIGGGNTFRLLHVLRRERLLSALRQFVRDGGSVYGGSAGAAVLGVDITTIAHLDVDSYSVNDTRGLDLVDEHGVFVHYRPQDASCAQDWVRRNRRPVIALHERAGAVVTEETLTAVGFEPVQLINAGARNVHPGETIMLPRRGRDAHPS